MLFRLACFAGADLAVRRPSGSLPQRSPDSCAERRISSSARCLSAQHSPLVAPAATRSVAPAAGGRRPGAEARAPVASVASVAGGVRSGVDRLGRRFDALVTGSAAGGLGIQPVARRLTYGRVEPTRSLGIRRRAAAIHGGATRAVGCRAAARRHGPGLSLRRTWQAGSSTVPMLARRAPSASAS
jgi:hypothetical protein